ncbi:MAG: DNA-binding protein [Chloroflexi bacterium]|nr:DNA-binding protein [Chloroflexota bacterium]
MQIVNSGNSDQFDWVNVKDACEILGVSRHTLHRFIEQGHLPAYRVKGVRSVQFKRADVLSLIERVDPADFSDSGISEGEE